MIMTFFGLCAPFLYLNFTDFFSKKKIKNYVQRAKKNSCRLGENHLPIVFGKILGRERRFSY